MIINMVGPFVANAPFGSEIAFAKGLYELGFVEGETLFCVDPNMDPEMNGLCQIATATIVFKSCIGNEEVLKKLAGPVITYQPDDARFPHIRQMMMLMRGYSDLFLSFDKHGADVAKTMGYRAAEELLLTADPDLYCIDVSKPKDIDISFIGSLHGPQSHASRRQMCNIAQKYANDNNLQTAFGETYDMRTLVDIYQRSKVVLNHATDVGQSFGHGFGLQCRHFEAGMTGTVVLSNVDDSHPPVLTSERFCPTFSDRIDLVEQLDHLIHGVYNGAKYGQADRNWKMWDLAGRAYYKTISEKHMPINRARQIVDFIKRHT